MLLKKQILQKYLLSLNKSHKTRFVYEEWVNDNVIGGYIDLQIKDEDNQVISIIDFKTGAIYEKSNNELRVKEAYIMQLSLYSYVVKQKQGFYPELFIQNLKGDKIKIEVEKKQIEDYYNRAKKLKNKLLSEEEESLAVVSEDNCTYCSYRRVCNKYLSNHINNLLKNSIDFKGEITRTRTRTAEIKINHETWLIKNIKYNSYPERKNAKIFNLYCNEELYKSRIVYETRYTLLEYE